MPKWFAKTLKRVRAPATARRVHLTVKATRELAGLGLGEDDACEVLAALESPDCVGRVRSDVTGEWLYVFKPLVAGRPVYLKLIVRETCAIISLHEDEGHGSEDTEEATEREDA